MGLLGCPTTCVLGSGVHWGMGHLTPFKDVKSKPIAREFPCGSEIMNPTSIHKDMGSIPGLTQGVKDLALP